jgi:phospholipase D1/2
MSTDAATRPSASAKRKPILWIGVVCVLVAGLALMWRFTPLADSIDPRHIAKRLETIEKYPWSPFAFISAYVVGGLVMFPVTVMSAATAIIFPPLKAVSVSFTGIMLSAALLHWIGARWIGERLRTAMGSVIEKVDQALSDRGIVTIATLRMIPIAPFTLVNIAAGAAGVNFKDYMLGTALGLAPGVTVICFFGRQVRAFWEDPSVSGVLVAVGIGVAWISLSIALQRWVSRRRQRHA